MTLPRPIGAIARLAQVIGPEAAFRLAEAHGGTRIYVPHRTAGSELARLIGEAEAAAMAREFRGGAQMKVPVAREWRVAAYRAAGETYDAIAVRLGIDIATVHRILRNQELTTRQLSLFPIES